MVWFCHLIYGTSVAHSLLCQGYGASVARGVCVCHPLYSAPPERPLAAVSLLLEPMSWICNPGLRARFDIFSKFVFASNSGKEISTFRFNRFAAVSRYEKVSKSVWCKSQQTESSLHICTFCKVLFLFGSTKSFAPPLLVCTSLIICDSEDLAPNISDAVSPLVEACTWFKVYFFLPGRVDNLRP